MGRKRAGVYTLNSLLYGVCILCILGRMRAGRGGLLCAPNSPLSEVCSLGRRRDVGVTCQISHICHCNLCPPMLPSPCNPGTLQQIVGIVTIVTVKGGGAGAGGAKVYFVIIGENGSYYRLLADGFNFKSKALTYRDIINGKNILIKVIAFWNLKNAPGRIHLHCTPVPDLLIIFLVSKFNFLHKKIVKNNVQNIVQNIVSYHKL